MDLAAVSEEGKGYGVSGWGCSGSVDLGEVEKLSNCDTRVGEDDMIRRAAGSNGYAADYDVY